MGNIYIETDENFRVTKIHRMPFDPTNGMGYTREELEKRGFFVDEIPEPVHQVGRRSIAMYNPDTKSIYYEFVGIPLSDKERLEYVENAFNALLDKTYGITSISTPMAYSARAVMDIDILENETEEPDENSKAIATYLAYQIISGKIDIDDCFKKYPDLVSGIKDVLAENGIQA